MYNKPRGSPLLNKLKERTMENPVQTILLSAFSISMAGLGGAWWTTTTDVVTLNTKHNSAETEIVELKRKNEELFKQMIKDNNENNKNLTNAMQDMSKSLNSLGSQILILGGKVDNNTNSIKRIEKDM